MENLHNQTILEAVDARTRLAGSNKMEILLFSLGTGETFGINVFKVREITHTPAITLAPNLPPGVEGVISLRGSIIPVISLGRFVNAHTPVSACPTMMVTEFNRRTQGFLLHDVDHIVRVDWDRVRAPDSMVSGGQGVITAITRLPDGRLISILDVEQVIASVFGEHVIPDIAPADSPDATVFFVDDSAVARKEIAHVLDKLSVQHHHAKNGFEAWERLQGLAARAQSEGVPLRQKLQLILTDAEMPEMDGYVLTRHIKEDTRFRDIPVVMHSSLSSEANKAMGKRVGADAYVAKFDPVVLADTLRAWLGAATKH
jgi:two-component system, chemotaxis family, chemotaxis protein CheV